MLTIKFAYQNTVCTKTRCIFHILLFLAEISIPFFKQKAETSIHRPKFEFVFEECLAAMSDFGDKEYF